MLLVAVTRLLHRTPLRPRDTLLIHPFLFQAFRRTPSMHPITLPHHHFSSTFDFRNPCPIDLTHFTSQTNTNPQLGSPRIVKSARKGKSLGSESEKLRMLDEGGIEGNEGLVCEGIWGVRDDWELALLVFRWGEARGWSGGKALGLVVWVLGSHGKFTVAWGLIRGSYTGSRIAMLVMIERYAAASYPRKAIKTFELMENIRASPDHNAFYTLLSALCQNGNVEEAEEFMLNNKKLFPLDTNGFNIILYGWSSVMDVEHEAKRVWRDMARCCITPNADSYELMISCLSRARKLFDSLKLYDEMKRKGWVPGIEVYNSLICVLANENCLDQALNTLKKIKELGLRPGSTTYNSLIGPLCKAGKFKEARELLTAMVEYDIAPTIDTYKAFLDTANVENGLEVLNQMKMASLGPDRDSFILLFDKFFRLRQPENALRMWVEMENYGVERESAHYSALIKGLVNCGCLLKAREMHSEMTSKPILQDPKLRRLIKERPRGGLLHRAQCMNTVHIPVLRRQQIIKGSTNRGGKNENHHSNRRSPLRLDRIIPKIHSL
ncbi:hypothetical protein Droror1_Dr00010071 [Drosera rotundifolia]